MSSRSKFTVILNSAICVLSTVLIMEFPDLGKHCSEKTCKQLDFLPVKCDACKQDFCKDHFAYAAHKCPFAFQKDVHVPVCPLCNTPIPVTKGQIPDVVVGDHIDRDCHSHPGKKKEKFSLLWLCPGILSLWRSLKPLRHHSSLVHPLLPYNTASLAGGSPSTAPRPPHRFLHTVAQKRAARRKRCCR
ncbi:AN1-type zinc finger protein 2A isoform X1 [Nomascus leucogenys]|uniref:AN1-type zinc finger protein 2A isoform X1 n=2 Tax=Nomascus leucogenys TaxID=61853 RepID=UPI00122DB653|nr:AN1-type zinc finger protein 2A isoform X1 [Nomascus leucogenys]